MSSPFCPSPNHTWVPCATSRAPALHRHDPCRFSQVPWHTRTASGPRFFHSTYSPTHQELDNDPSMDTRPHGEGGMAGPNPSLRCRLSGIEISTLQLAKSWPSSIANAIDRPSGICCQRRNKKRIQQHSTMPRCGIVPWGEAKCGTGRVCPFPWQPWLKLLRAQHWAPVGWLPSWSR